jgi:hypothetical protein
MINDTSSKSDIETSAVQTQHVYVPTSSHQTSSVRSAALQGVATKGADNGTVSIPPDIEATEPKITQLIDGTSPKLEYIPPPTGLKIPIELDPSVKNLDKLDELVEMPVQILRLASANKIEVNEDRRKERQFQMDSLKNAIGDDAVMEAFPKRTSPKNTKRPHVPVAEKPRPVDSTHGIPQKKAPKSLKKSPQKKLIDTESTAIRPEVDDGADSFDFFVEEGGGGDQSMIPSKEASSDHIQEQIRNLGKAPPADAIAVSSTHLYHKAPLLHKYEVVAENAAQDRIIEGEFRKGGAERASVAASLLEKPLPDVLQRTEQMVSAAKQSRKEEVQDLVKKEEDSAARLSKPNPTPFISTKPKALANPTLSKRKPNPNSKLVQPEVMRFQDNMMLKPFDMMRKEDSLPQWGGGDHGNESDEDGNESEKKDNEGEVDMSFLYEMSHDEEYRKFPPLVVTEHPAWRKYFHIAEEEIRAKSRAEFFSETELEKQERLLRERQVALSKAEKSQDSPQSKRGNIKYQDSGMKVSSAWWREQRNQRMHELDNGGQSIQAIAIDVMTHDQVLGNEWKYFKIDVTEEFKRDILAFELTVVEGDADLFISSVTIPSVLDFQWKSTAAGLAADRIAIFPDDPHIKNRNGPVTFYVGIFGATDVTAPFSFICMSNRIEVEEGECLGRVGQLINKLNGINMGLLDLDGEEMKRKEKNSAMNSFSHKGMLMQENENGAKISMGAVSSIKSAQEKLMQLEHELQLLEISEDSAISSRTCSNLNEFNFPDKTIVDSVNGTPKSLEDLQISGSHEGSESHFLGGRLLSPHLIEMMKFEDDKLGNEDEPNVDGQYSDTESVDENEVDRCLQNHGNQYRACGIGVWTEKQRPDVSVMRSSNSLPQLGGLDVRRDALGDQEFTVPFTMSPGDYTLMKKKAGAKFNIFHFM